MTIQKADGTVVTQSTFNSNITEQVQPSLWLIDQDYYETYHLVGDPETVKNGKRLKYRAGRTITTAQKADLYKEPTISTVTPGTAGTGGGVVLTIVGTNLDEVTGVTLGGTACTSVTVVSKTTIRATTPAKSAATYSVAVTTPAGTATKSNAVVVS